MSDTITVSKDRLKDFIQHEVLGAYLDGAMNVLCELVGKDGDYAGGCNGKKVSVFGSFGSPIPGTVDTFKLPTKIFEQDITDITVDGEPIEKEPGDFEFNLPYPNLNEYKYGEEEQSFDEHMEKDLTREIGHE